MINTITAALTAAQVETTTSLWTPSNTVTFTPAVLDQTFGDGRALFRVTTINARPRWWLVRGCSTWTDKNDAHDGLTPIFDRIDEIVQAIADQFGGLPNLHDENADDDKGEDHRGPAMQLSDPAAHQPILSSRFSSDLRKRGQPARAPW